MYISDREGRISLAYAVDTALGTRASARGKSHVKSGPKEKNEALLALCETMHRAVFATSSRAKCIVV